MDKRFEHRMATNNVRFVGNDGSPLKSKKIGVSQVNHKFLFSCGAFDSVPLVNNEVEGKDKEILKERFDKWLALFNAGTLLFIGADMNQREVKPDQNR
mgnify:CR=1 FL=1